MLGGVCIVVAPAVQSILFSIDYVTRLSSISRGGMIRIRKYLNPPLFFIGIITS